MADLEGYDRDYRDLCDADSLALAELDTMPPVPLGAIDQLNRHVFADGSPVQRLTGARREQLDREWFGRQGLVEVPQRPKVVARPPVTLVCPVCGDSFTRSHAEIQYRKSRSSTKTLYCSLACWGASARRPKAQKEAS